MLKGITTTFVLLIITSCTVTTSVSPSMSLTWGMDKFDSSKNEFTRSYCVGEYKTKTVKLILTPEETNRLIDSAIETHDEIFYLDEDTDEKLQKICVSSGSFGMELTVIRSNSSEEVQLYFCEETSKFQDVLDELIYNSQVVKSLADTGCRYY